MATFKKRDPQDALQRERAALVAAQAKATELQRERAGKLLESDGFDEVWRIDRQLAEQHSRIEVHTARVAAFERANALADWQRAERERIEAIDAVLVPNVQKCEKLARDVDIALTSFSKAWTELDEAARDVNIRWPSAVPRPPRYAFYEIGDGQNHILRALQTDKDRVSNLARRAGSVAEPVQRAGARFLETIRKMKIPSPAPTPEQTEPEAAVPAAAEEAA